MIPFGSKFVTLSMLIDLLTSRCRSTQVKLYTGLIASIDLWPQEMFTFSEMLALVQSESSFGAFVFHRRPAGLQATSDLVKAGPPWLEFLVIFDVFAPWYRRGREASSVKISLKNLKEKLVKCATEVARLHKVSIQSCTQNRPSPKVQSLSRDWI